MRKSKRVHNADTRPATLVMDGALESLKAQAEGAQPFTRSGLYERLSALDLKEFYKLPARERLAVGFYQTAKRRAEALKDAE
jgi:hypothetical protein